MILIREGVKMFVPVLAAILIFIVIILCVWRLVKEKSAEKERADEEEKKATPDPN
jgi:Na+/H+ antiporter NhaD/arsenite permease-like protein